MRMVQVFDGRRGAPAILVLDADTQGGHVSDIDLEHVERERARIRATWLKDPAERLPSSARGVHHVALLSADVERTVRFYADVLEFPLTDIFENRDYAGSNHFFFDLGHGNLIAFFDFPDLGLGPYAEVLGGLHHLSISVEPERWMHLRGKLEAAGVPYQLESGTSIYFRDPDGARLELIADPLGEMYGHRVL
ncbi:MAG TPA: VOC family protein [Mycobacteriales bacterium]|nr:VOC family protein [Mycobacteriales bacterium]